MLETLGLIIGAALALSILSYLAGDNPLYRLGLHLFVGVVVGYSFGVVVREVLLQMALPSLLSDPSSVLVPVALGVLLLVKGFPKQAFVGNFSMAHLIGVGTGVAMGGALLGTLAPQVRATGQALSRVSLTSLRFGIIDGLMIVVGTVSTLLAFTFTKPEGRVGRFTWAAILDGIARIGRVFLIFAFGVAFAGALTASLSIFVGRMEHFIGLALRLMGL